MDMGNCTPCPGRCRPSLLKYLFSQRSHATASVVGFDILPTGRRRRQLLSYEDQDVHWRSRETEKVEHMLHNASWSGAGDLCRSLVHAYRVNDTMGVMDRHHLKECLHVRLMTNNTMEAYNATLPPDLGDTFMLTWHGVARVSDS